MNAVKDLLNDRGQRNIGQECADEHTTQQRERHGHAEIAERQEADRHQHQDDGCAHGRTLIWASAMAGAASSSGGSGWSKPLRRPLTSCSMVKSAISTPEIGMMA